MSDSVRSLPMIENLRAELERISESHGNSPSDVAREAFGLIHLAYQHMDQGGAMWIMDSQAVIHRILFSGNAPQHGSLRNINDRIDVTPTFYADVKAFAAAHGKSAEQITEDAIALVSLAYKAIDEGGSICVSDREARLFSVRFPLGPKSGSLLMFPSD